MLSRDLNTRIRTVRRLAISTLIAMQCLAGIPLVAADPAPSVFSRLHIPKIGVDYSIFVPTGQHTRDRFGDPWVEFGIRLGDVPRPQTGGKLGPEFGIRYRTSGGNFVWVVPIGIKYEGSIGHGNSFVPFAGVSLDLDPVYLRSKEDGIGSSLHLTAGGSIYVGANLGHNTYLRAAYIGVSQVAGFDLSGISLGAGIRF